MKHIYRLISLFLTVVILFSATACSKSEDAYIYFELPEAPMNLDPQIASNDAELIIVRNVFEGLLRTDENGKITPAVAKDYEKNGLEYTFYLGDSKWSDGTKITAFDFEFAFKRAVDPKTCAPFASRLFSIKGAQNILNKKANIDTLGVKALNDTTLKITLTENDSDFLQTLTTSIAMPCNEKFFNSCDGKYGISAETLLYNGSYQMTRWRKDPFGIRLYKSDTYNGNFEAKNSAVFITHDDEEDIVERLKKESIDIAFIDSTRNSQAKSQGLKTKSFQNICWVMTIGKEFTPDMRKAFSYLVSGEIYSSSLPEGYKVATSLYPQALDIEKVGNDLNIYDKNTAKKLYLRELKKYEDAKFPADKLLYFYDNGQIKNVVTDIVGHWQSNLSAFVNIKSASNPDTLSSQLTDNSYPFAVFPIKADSAFMREYVDKFGLKSLSKDPAVNQEKILENNTVIPIMFQDTVIAHTPDITEFNASLGNGYIDFAYIVKEP